MNKMLPTQVAAHRRVMKSLARLHAHEGNSVLPIRREDGTAPILIVVPEEAVGQVAQKAKTMGACVNLIVAFADYFRILVWDNDAAEEEEVVDVNPAANMEMLCTLMDSNAGSASFNIVHVTTPVRELEYQF